MAKDEYHFERLTPINDIELKVYEDAINYVFENQEETGTRLYDCELHLPLHL